MPAMRWNPTDGGRAAAGFRGEARDCVTRAVAVASGRPYREVYDVMAAIEAKRGKARSARNGVKTQSAAFKRQMVEWGFAWTATMGIGTGCRVTLKDGALPMGRHVVLVSRHAAAVIDDVLHDAHDCGRGGTRCVYGYWTLTEEVR